MTLVKDQDMMLLALSYARRGRGYTCPNPAVGAIITRDGKVIAVGYHRQCGQAHAEQEALERAGEAARGATLYVTLEPCDHMGKTPSCTEAILQAGIVRVVVGASDPNLLVRGRGLERLRAAGVEVVTGIQEEKCRMLNADYNYYISNKVPWVTLKWAMTLDGKIATSTGDSRWISGEKARQFAHRLRAAHAAVLIGVGTALRDDPELTLRHAQGRQPLRVVLDGHGRLPHDARLLQTLDKAPLLMVTSVAAPAQWRWRLEGLGVEVAVVDTAADGHISIHELLKELGRREVMSVLVEGGAATLGSFYRSEMWNRLCAIIAPKLIGGSDGLSPLGGAGTEHISDALVLDRATILRLGDDLLMEGYRTV